MKAKRVLLRDYRNWASGDWLEMVCVCNNYAFLFFVYLVWKRGKGEEEERQKEERRLELCREVQLVIGGFSFKAFGWGATQLIWDLKIEREGNQGTLLSEDFVYQNDICGLHRREETDQPQIAPHLMWF